MSANFHPNYIQNNSISDFEILQTLGKLPSLYFTEKGIENLCKRFGVTESHLRYLISSAQKIRR